MVKSRVKGRGRRGGKTMRKHRGGKSTRKHRGGKRRTKRCRTGGRRNKKMRGGYGKGAGPVGYPYKGGDVATWPGVYSSILGGNTDGMTMANYYPLSAVGIPSGPLIPPISTDNVMPVQAGGAPLWLTKILPNEAVNIPRLALNGLGNAYDSYVGQQTMESPLPQYQPIGQNQVPLINDIPNVPLIHLQAGQAAADI